MRNDLRVTDIETVVPEGVFIYSCTDLKGIIVEANQAFAEISAYQQSDMIGQPHNLVRHPDMPAEAFTDLWRTLKAGQPWRGLVKNRRSDGGYYWVIANASPVRENGRVIGYQSVRSRPSREQIAAAAAAYARIKAGDKRIKIERGRVVRVLPAWLDKLISTQGQIALVAGVLLLNSLLNGIGALNLVQAGFMTGITAIISFLLASYLLLGFLPRLNRDLGNILTFLHNVLSSGDLTLQQSLERRDSIGEIGRLSFSFVASVRATIKAMALSLEQVASAAGQVGEGMAEIGKSAQVQNVATSAAAATVEQLTISIQEVAIRAGDTQREASESREAATKGEQLSDHASEGIQTLSSTVDTATEKVGALGQTVAEIGDIASIIKDIAAQTNLLALNAAIEAARAGEEGRGFAVVADEVRKLAERTQSATEQINELINSTSSDSAHAISGMNEGVAQMEHSVALVQAARTSLIQINQHMAQTATMVNEITHATSEQSNAMTELAQNVERVASMTEQNVAVVERGREQVNQLNGNLNRLSKTVCQYGV